MMNLHAILERSRANGPGLRTVIWFQGCSLQCPGCFNPETHSAELRLIEAVGSLVETLAASPGEVEGITVSGGEPLQQPDGLLELLWGVRERTALSVILFSGYTAEEIRSLPSGPEILSLVDVLIAGRYDERLRPGTGLRGSSNQTIHLLTNRYRLAQIDDTPHGEVSIGEAGTITISGVQPPRLSLHDGGAKERA